MAVKGLRIDRDITYDGQGATARKIILCNWTDVDPIYDSGGSLGLPKYGDPWDVTYAPLLKCVSVNCKQFDVNLCEVTANYSTDGEVVANFYRVTLRSAVETLDAGIGWKWSTLDTAVEQRIPYRFPVWIYEIEKKQDLTRAQTLTAAGNVAKLNDRVFHGFAIGTLRLDAFNVNENYNDGALADSTITYTFTARGRDWREEWHEAEQKIDAFTGTPMIWQDKIATDDNGVAMENYTTDAAKIGTPVFFSGARGGNIAGHGDGWGAFYKPYYKDAAGNVKYMYELANFGSVLSLPLMSGDDAI